MSAQQEPASVDVGFSHNKRGGWWYREPKKRYTLQIIPAGKERRGWMLGIVLGGPIRWGRRSYPSPDAAAFQACRVVEDKPLADRIADAMRARHDARKLEIHAQLKRERRGAKRDADQESSVHALQVNPKHTGR